MSRFTLTIDLPDGYDETVARDEPETVAQEILNGVFADCTIESAGLLRPGHRIDADIVDSQVRHDLAAIEAENIVVVVAVDAVDLSDHPGLRKRCWVLDGMGIHRAP